MSSSGEIHLSAVIGAALWHDFIAYEADGLPSWVTAELIHAEVRTADPDLVALYEAAWERLWSASVQGDEATALIRTMPSP